MNGFHCLTLVNEVKNYNENIRKIFISKYDLKNTAETKINQGEIRDDRIKKMVL